MKVGFKLRDLFCSKAVFLKQFVPLLLNIFRGFGDGFGLQVIEFDETACLGCDLGDSLAHGASADNANGLKSRIHRGIIAEPFLGHPAI